MLAELELVDVLSVAATFTVIEQATEMLSAVPFADEDIAALQQFPSEVRLQMLGRLIELSEYLRQALIDLDGRVLQLRH